MYTGLHTLDVRGGGAGVTFNTSTGVDPRMDLPTPVACGLDTHFARQDWNAAERITFIHPDGAAERVEEGYTLAHESGNGAILVWDENCLDALPDWADPGSRVLDSVVVAEDGRVKASFNRYAGSTHDGTRNAVILLYEGG